MQITNFNQMAQTQQAALTAARRLPMTNFNERAQAQQREILELRTRSLGNLEQSAGAWTDLPGGLTGSQRANLKEQAEQTRKAHQGEEPLP